MYKWHVHSAIGRGRPLANDFQRVTEGIAASLRNFSASASRAEDGDELRKTRSQRGAEAANELLSAPRGIDARSLAAKPPPQAFTIRRTPVDGTRSDLGGNSGAFFGRSQGGGAAGGSGGSGGGRVAARGRGGSGGRGARGGRRGRGGGRRPRSKLRDESEAEPFTEEEIEWIAGDTGGWPTPYEPKTSLEQLLGKGLTIMGSPAGTLEAAMTKAQLGTNNVSGNHRHADEHIVKMEKGDGTFFESKEAKAITQTYLDDQRKRVAELKKVEFTPQEIPTLPQAEREKISKAWLAGHYNAPESAKKGDFLGQAETYTTLNETYLPEDSRKLQAKLASLLPSLAQKPRSRAARPL